MDNNIKKRRLKTLRNYLKFLEQRPDDWNNLRLSCRNNVSEYSSFLKDYCSIFNNIPTKLVKAKDLLSNAKKWESYKVEWYKELSSNYPDSWIPISDFQSGEDEMFVDIADEGKVEDGYEATLVGFSKYYESVEFNGEAKNIVKENSLLSYGYHPRRS